MATTRHSRHGGLATRSAPSRVFTLESSLLFIGRAVSLDSLQQQLQQSLGDAYTLGRELGGGGADSLARAATLLEGLERGENGRL